MDKIINLLINNWTKGVDTYTHNGSTWLIFTEQRSWVIELTESKTLWYNYNFFKELFSLTSMDVVDNQHYITKWVEDNIINKVKDTILEKNITEGEVEEIIENGVKHTVTANNHIFDRVDDAIQNGVKHTEKSLQIDGSCVIEDTVQNGVKETNHVDVMKFFDNKMEDAIQNGVKETQFNSYENKSWIEGVIKGGVRHTLNTEYMPTSMVEDIIENGVKHTEYGDWLDGDERLDDIIQNGVKETKTPGKDGDIMSTIEWMEENKSTSYTKMINDVIDNGIKETKHANKYNSIGPVIKEGKINHIIDNGVKVSGTFVGGNRQKENIESVIGYGTKNPTD